MIKILKSVFEFLIPQFVTDRVALGFDQENSQYYVICLEHQVREDDTIEAFGTIGTVTWLGISFGGHCILDKT